MTFLHTAHNFECLIYEKLLLKVWASTDLWHELVGELKAFNSGSEIL